MMALPELFQLQGVERPSLGGIDPETEAREFMRAYAEDVRAGRREAIANRYDSRGAYRVGEGRKNLEPWPVIQASYMSEWNPPSRFAWRDLSYEVIASDAVMVIGLFDWGIADGRTLTFSYTGLLVRRDGRLRIRLEDESISPRAVAAFTAVAAED